MHARPTRAPESKSHRNRFARRNILSADSRALLEHFACSNVILVFDYDGTLAPIVPDFSRADMKPQTRELLRRLSELYPIAVVSGRAQQDVSRLVEELGVTIVLGNHGDEWGASSHSAATEQRVAGWRALLEEALSPFAGVIVEDKRFSLTVHYRLAERRSQAMSVLGALASQLESARILGGKEAVNIVPLDAENKGTAVQRIRRMCHCDAAVYVGDDVTDEDVFSLDEPWLLTIRVGQSTTTGARYFLARQDDVDELMGLFIALRAGTAGMGER